MASGSAEPATAGEDAGDVRFAEFSDLQLRERLRRIQNWIVSGVYSGLHDGGEKAHQLCRDIGHEIARRRKVSSALPSAFSSTLGRSAHPAGGSKPHRAPVSAIPSAGDAGVEDRHSALRQLSDLALREKLRCLQDGVGVLARHLPDGGRKYFAYIRAVRLELARRQALPSRNQSAAAEPGASVVSKAEMLPLVHRFQLLEVPAGESIFPKGAPWARYCGNYKGLHIDLVWPGKDPALGVDSVGTLSAALVTYASIQFLKPDLIINAGTASGFKAKGAGIGDVFLASDVVFHDRRTPTPVLGLYGNGARKTFVTPSMLKELNLKVGKLSTGDSRDMSPHDVLEILSNGATLKDMEGAAVAHVADMFSTPAIFVKAATEIVDGEKPRAEEFLQNLTAATKALDQAVAEVVNFISG
ncbi:hypothetical protein ACQJBY_029489 [Aegilops geniculata]